MAREREPGLRVALDAIGGVRALARIVGRSSSTVSLWKRIPVDHVLAIELITKIPREELRPDVYPPARRLRRRA